MPTDCWLITKDRSKTFEFKKYAYTEQISNLLSDEFEQ